MSLEESMDILVALKQEEVKLQRQLKGIQGAILALNGSHPGHVSSKLVSPNGVNRKRTNVCSGQGKDFEVDERALEEVQSRKGQKSEVGKTKSFYKIKSPDSGCRPGLFLYT
jgi:hypothetical protein